MTNTWKQFFRWHRHIIEYSDRFQSLLVYRTHGGTLRLVGHLSSSVLIGLEAGERERETRAKWRRLTRLGIDRSSVQLSRSRKYSMKWKSEQVKQNSKRTREENDHSWYYWSRNNCSSNILQLWQTILRGLDGTLQKTWPTNHDFDDEL